MDHNLRGQIGKGDLGSLRLVSYSTSSQGAQEFFSALGRGGGGIITLYLKTVFRNDEDQRNVSRSFLALQEEVAHIYLFA